MEIPNVEMRSEESISLQSFTTSGIDDMVDMLNHGGQFKMGIAVGKEGQSGKGNDSDDDDDDAATFYAAQSFSNLSLEDNATD